MIVFWRSPFCDFVLIIFILFLWKQYFLKQDLNEEERLFIKYSNPWVRIFVVMSLTAEVSYVVGTDIALFEGKYYIHSLLLSVITIYLCALWGIYIGYEYGPRTKEYIDRLKLRSQAAVALPALFLMMYFFM